MGVTVTNLIQGAATVWIGAFGVTEPLDTAVNIAPATGWTDMGSTDGGVKLVIDQKFSMLNVDQLVDNVAARKTSRVVSVSTSLAEPTLANLLVVLNSSQTTVTTGTGFASFTPETDDPSVEPTYRALIMDGLAPAGFRRRVIIRKALVTDAVDSSYQKEKETYFGVKWDSFWVSTSIKPFKIVDQTS